jgi:hypothetical protein
VGLQADGIDSYVGINLVAVALVLLLIDYDAPYQQRNGTFVHGR